MTERSENSDEKLIGVVGSTIAKVVLYICGAIVFGLWIDSCQLDEDILANCEASCESLGSHMESVTSRECVCAKSRSMIEPITDSWVLPR